MVIYYIRPVNINHAHRYHIHSFLAHQICPNLSVDDVSIIVSNDNRKFMSRVMGNVKVSNSISHHQVINTGKWLTQEGILIYETYRFYLKKRTPRNLIITMHNDLRLSGIYDIDKYCTENNINLIIVLEYRKDNQFGILLKLLQPETDMSLDQAQLHLALKYNYDIKEIQTISNRYYMQYKDIAHLVNMFRYDNIWDMLKTERIN
jgi:hypothetical protein